MPSPQKGGERPASSAHAPPGTSTTHKLPLAPVSRSVSDTSCLRPCVVCFPQTTRFNVMNAERIRKVNAGEPTPKLVNDQIKAGELKVPWTNAS